MKNSTDPGFDQAYNVQAVVDQATLLVMGHRVTNHPNDKHETLPTLDAVPAAVGRPQAAAGDNGFYSAANIAGLEARHRALSRDRPRTAPPELAGVLRRAAHATTRRCQPRG